MSLSVNTSFGIDWLTISVPGEHLYLMCCLFDFHFDNFSDGGGRYRKKYYCASATYDGVSFYSDYLPDIVQLIESDSSVFVEFTGQGVGNYFSCFSSFIDFVSSCVNDWSCSVTRLDVCIDVFDGSVSAAKVFKAVTDGYCDTRSKKFSIVSSGVIGVDGLDSTCYIGSRGSNLLVRVYDKLSLSKLKGLDVSHLNNWCRVEYEFHSELSHALIVRLVESTYKGSYQSTIKNTLLGHLDFRSDKRRLVWWSKIFTDAVKNRITVPKKKKTIDDKKAWLDKTVARTLAEVEEEYPGNADRLINKGKKRQELNIDNLYSHGDGE